MDQVKSENVTSMKKNHIIVYDDNDDDDPHLRRIIKSKCLFGNQNVCFLNHCIKSMTESFVEVVEYEQVF